MGGGVIDGREARWRYWNANGASVAIVAVATAGIDWGAYIGGTPDDRSEFETVEWVARHGCKRSESEARAFFDGELPYRD